MKNKKPLWIALGALAGVFLIAVVIAVIVGIVKKNSNEMNNLQKSADDAPYPYSWQEKDGVITLTLTSKDLKNGVWKSASGTVVDIDLGKPKNGNTVVTMRPRELGREDVTFLLSDGSVVVAEAIFTVEVDRAENEQLFATVSAHEERLVQGTLTGGTDGDYPFTITSENGVLLLKISDPALADAVPTDDDASETSGESAETDEEAAGTETAEESDTPSGSVLADEDAAEKEYDEDLEYDEDTDNSGSPAEAQSPESVSDRWRIITSDSLVARPVLVNIEADGITYRIETEVNGEATVTLYNSTAKVAYVFSLVSRQRALTVSGYQAGKEPPANTASQEELGQLIVDGISDLQPYTPPPATEDPVGDQDEGSGQ